jgi:hemolysin activation/secretion protein
VKVTFCSVRAMHIAISMVWLPVMWASTACLPVYAQPTLPVLPATPDPTPELRRQQERLQEQQTRQQPSVDVRSQQAAPAEAAKLLRLPTNEMPCFPIQRIEFIGSEADRFSWLQKHMAGHDGTDSPIGKCLGAEGIGLSQKRVQDALIEQGFVTSRILTQPQDISKGALAFELVIGRIRNIRFADPVTSNQNQAPNQASTPSSAAKPAPNPARLPALSTLPLRAGNILNLRDIEQGLEILKRVPTAEADIQIAPGATPGESDLLITYKDAGLFRVQASMDDSGSKATGRYQGAVTVSVDNPLRLNDLFYFSYNHSLGQASTRGTQGQSLHYSVPVQYWTLALNASDSSYRQVVAGVTQAYVYSGKSRNIDVKASRLLYRDASKKFSVSAKLFSRQSENYIDDTEVEVQRRQVGGWEAGANYKQYVGAATWEANLAYKRGTGAFGSIPAPEEAFGEGTSRFALINADLNYAQPFKIGVQPLRYQANWRVQHNRTPLTPQDRMAIGSRYSVRGFDGESSLSSERGWLWRNDLNMPLGQTGQELYLGLDHGRVGGPSSQSLVGNSLSGAALGLRGGFKGLQYDIFAGRPISKPENFSTRKTVYGFNLNYSF